MLKRSGRKGALPRPPAGPDVGALCAANLRRGGSALVPGGVFTGSRSVQDRRLRPRGHLSASEMAHYSLADDHVVLPERSQRPSKETYTHTALHEMGHATGDSANEAGGRDHVNDGYISDGHHFRGALLRRGARRAGESGHRWSCVEPEKTQDSGVARAATAFREELGPSPDHKREVWGASHEDREADCGAGSVAATRTRCSLARYGDAPLGSAQIARYARPPLGSRPLTALVWTTVEPKRLPASPASAPCGS